jgi:predicted DNA-binding transcriptional regulator YafY
MRAAAHGVVDRAHQLFRIAMKETGAQGADADIRGEAGIGYILKPGFFLPPLMFPLEEIEALALGARWVVDRADEPLRDAARSALARIAAVLPPDVREALETSTLVVGPGTPIPDDVIDPAILRQAIRTEKKLALSYRDAEGTPSRRIVWPFAFAYFDTARILLGWCELRNDFRHFRTDRIAAADVLDSRSPRRRRILFDQWRKARCSCLRECANPNLMLG